MMELKHLFECYRLTLLNVDYSNILVHTLNGFLKPVVFKEGLKLYSPVPTSLSGAIWDAMQYPGHAHGDGSHILHETSWKYVPPCNGSWGPGWTH